MLSFNDFALCKIETAVLCSDKESYTMYEIHEMVNTAIDDYEFEYNATVKYLSEINFTSIKNMLKDMGIEVVR